MSNWIDSELMSLMDYDLGYFDLETRVLEPLENPFGQKCYLCGRYILSPMSPGRNPGWTHIEWRPRSELNRQPAD
jgi:hypothetical protein